MSPIEVLGAMGSALGGLRWVHGPGGNVSVKTADELWIKASGTRLSDVANDGNHVRVALPLARRALDGDAQADAELFDRKPRPSLETYFHVLGGPVVAHTHALGALLHACARDQDDLGPRFRAIPYITPGRGIALGVRDILDDSVDVVVLRSHGIIAYADSAERAIAATRDLDDRLLARHGRGAPSIDGFVADYLAADVRQVEGGVARLIPARVPRHDPVRYLFPDAPVCATHIAVARVTDDLAAEAMKRLGRSCVLVDPTGARRAVGRNATALAYACEVAAAHDWLEDALGARAAYLPDDEPARIVGLPSEQYRIRLEVR